MVMKSEKKRICRQRTAKKAEVLFMLFFFMTENKIAIYQNLFAGKEDNMRESNNARYLDIFTTLRYNIKVP